MRSIRGSLNQYQPLIDVSVGNPDLNINSRKTCQALIDTGATRTCITQRLVEQLGLPARQKVLVASATSFPERRRAYEFSIGLFCRSEITTETALYVVPSLLVAPVFQNNSNFDVLLGMDVLSQGRLIFDVGGDFSFSFSF
jgi:Aspartyl protease